MLLGARKDEAAPGDSEGGGRFPKRGGLRPRDCLIAAERDEGPGPEPDIEYLADLPGKGVALSDVSFESSWRGVGIWRTGGVPGTGEASRAVEKLLPGEPNGEDSRRELVAPDWTGIARDELDVLRLCDAIMCALWMMQTEYVICSSDVEGWLLSSQRCSAVPVPRDNALPLHRSPDRRAECTMQNA